ncbi:MAG TPA: hypothetical protein VNM92_06850 [Thermoanaerobaculia bacterium]|nr:hypothetical protein [Thermoanaerobaculia bacterium]
MSAERSVDQQWMRSAGAIFEKFPGRMSDQSDINRILADLVKNRQVLEKTLGEETGAKAASEIVEKLRALRRRADLTSSLVEELDRARKERKVP